MKTNLKVSIIFVLLMNIFMIGCTSSKSLHDPPYDPPEITITIEDKELEYVIGKNVWNNSIYDREDTFREILKKGSKIEIPYIELGKTVVISFNSYPPDNLTISDILLDIDGYKKYPSIDAINIPVELKNGKCSFEISRNIETLLDSNWVPGMTYNRGFRIIATWGNNECEYAFIIRTYSLSSQSTTIIDKYKR